MSERKVAGNCPMGCGETLFLGNGGHVTCGLVGCPNPTAVDTVLAERETEHVVVFTLDGFSIQHPLRERVMGEMFNCGLHEHCLSLDGPPAYPGRYRALETSDGWRFTPDKTPREGES